MSCDNCYEIFDCAIETTQRIYRALPTIGLKDIDDTGIQVLCSALGIDASVHYQFPDSEHIVTKINYMLNIGLLQVSEGALVCKMENLQTSHRKNDELLEKLENASKQLLEIAKTLYPDDDCNSLLESEDINKQQYGKALEFLRMEMEGFEYINSCIEHTGSYFKE